MAKMPILCKTCGTRVVVETEEAETIGPVPTPLAPKPQLPPASLEPPRSGLADFVIAVERETPKSIAKPNQKVAEPIPKDLDRYLRALGSDDSYFKPNDPKATDETWNASFNPDLPKIILIKATRKQRALAKLVEVMIWMPLILAAAVGAVLIFEKQIAITVTVIVGYGISILRWWIVARTGQDLGKMLLKLRVYTYDLQQAGFYRAVWLRELPFLMPKNIIGLLLLYLPFEADTFAILNVLKWAADVFIMSNYFTIFRPSGQCFHDDFAKTIVMNELPPPRALLHPS
jgi:uncharacterized RDD family membrane protein YckC